MKNRLFRLFAQIPIVAIALMWLIAPVFAVDQTPLTCNMSTVSGDDDGSFQMTLPFSLQLGTVEYNQIYYSTNGLMSFGQPDGNFWSYPQTPSVTLAGRDWVSWGPGAYTSYGYNESSFCIEWSVRPFPQSSGDLTQIRLVVNRFPNGAWHGEITTLGWIPPDIRRGIVWEQGGTPLPIEAAFDVNGGVPIEVEPAPQPTSFTEPPAIPTQCWDGSTVYAPAVCPVEPSPTPTESSPEPTPTPTETVVEPSPTPTPIDTQTPSPEPSAPTQTPTPEPSVSTSPSPTVTPLPIVSKTPEPQTSPSEVQQPVVVFPSESASPAVLPSQDPEIILPSDNTTTEEYTVLENGVVLPTDVAEALEIFDNPDALFAALVTDPGKIIKAFTNIGADMTKEQRDESTKVIVAAVIAGQLMNALSAANMIGRKL